MKRSKAVAEPDPKVKKALVKLGEDVAAARKFRDQSLRLFAERAGVSVMTLRRLEDGDPAVSVGIVATVLASLGMLGGLRRVASEVKDPHRQALKGEPTWRSKRRWRTRTRDVDF